MKNGFIGSIFLDGTATNKEQALKQHLQDEQAAHEHCYGQASPRRVSDGLRRGGHWVLHDGGARRGVVEHSARFV